MKDKRQIKTIDNNKKGLSFQQKQEVDKVIKKAIREYGKTLRMLGNVQN